MLYCGHFREWNKYLTILEEFNNKFKQLSKLGGIRNKNYVFYDNSYCIWGINDEYYEKLKNQFLKINSLKIVRIFGSRVTENYSEFSDIDLIFEGTYNIVDVTIRGNTGAIFQYMPLLKSATLVDVDRIVES